MKKAHVQGHSELSSRGKELHDRAINPLMNGVFVQERTSTIWPTYEEGLLPLQISSISPSIQNITRCIKTAVDGENIKLKRVIRSNPQSIEFWLLLLDSLGRRSPLTWCQCPLMLSSAIYFSYKTKCTHQNYKTVLKICNTNLPIIAMIPNSIITFT